MQMMALHAGGSLNQHLPDTHPDHAIHWDNEHEILPSTDALFSRGAVHSRHRQAVENPGDMGVLAIAPDGLIEAVNDPGRPFYVGVQWHPERTDDPALGAMLFQKLISCVNGNSA
ncbi:MAG TPA: gamma-glutamyl-gamma-aminobutyrate hydrolase family protein, partial [Phycisphaerales bacterium]|nr:gamma-glutamyl-gamma-aminobutyrate hydrolase family protein [Phycisphaerales bacterium]